MNKHLILINKSSKKEKFYYIITGCKFGLYQTYTISRYPNYHEIENGFIGKFPQVDPSVRLYASKWYTSYLKREYAITYSCYTQYLEVKCMSITHD